VLGIWNFIKLILTPSESKKELKAEGSKLKEIGRWTVQKRV
jgi:hypothetical protein